MRSCCQAVSGRQLSISAVLNSVESTPTPTTPTPLDNNIGLGSDKKDQTKEHLWHLQSLCPQWKTDWAIILHSVTVNELYFCIQLVKHYYDQYDWVRRWLWLRIKERDCQKKFPRSSPGPFLRPLCPTTRINKDLLRGPKTLVAWWHCHPEGFCASRKFLRVTLEIALGSFRTV